MDLKQILRLRLDGYSNRLIGATLGISRNTVNGYTQQFDACEFGLDELLKLDCSNLEELFPGKTSIENPRFSGLMKYFDQINLARKHPGFTCLHHYEEYKQNTDNAYGYTQFMEHYNRKYSKVKGSMKLNHKAGNELFIDFAGTHLHLTDKETGELKAVEVFLAILPCSQYTYVEACFSQKREDLISCIANALLFYGGVPNAIVSDNLKSAVSRASKYEPQINKSLKDFARFYGCVINPTRAYSPQDKALVENAVQLGYQRIYYPMRNMTFFSIKDLNKQIKILLKDHNDMLFQLKESSRRELFQTIEQTYLKPLPEEKYELKEYCRAKVQKMGYVYFSPDKHYYSVPYRFIGKQTQLHYTKSTVEVYFNNERIAKHSRNPAKGVYTTIKEHLRSAHQAYSSWSPDYFKNMAKKHGQAVEVFVNTLICQNTYPEAAYKSAMGVIHLHRVYGSERLNNACQRALDGHGIKYPIVKNILERSLDKEPLSGDQLNDTKPHIPPHNNTRGASEYQ
ncbi:MAG: IS21 family transposase [Mariprofundaceae bacterium]|nr:IS21 family transposase [Mariprofundaceae bacterium]